MTPVKMEKHHQWINPDNHSIAVDDQKQPVVNENGDLIVLDNTTGKCIAVPNTDEILEIFGFGYSPAYASPSGSQKESTPDPDMKPIVQIVTESEQLLWSMRTPCQKDIEATREMLALVASKRYQDMFNDQCTVKIRVWKRICEELMEKGFRIADSVNEGGIKCHQKWRNLEKSYRNYLISSTDPNSPAPKKPPPYFEALHDILKTKKKYANAVAYTQTVVVSDMIDPDTSVSGGGGGGGQLNDSDVVEELDDADGQNDDHCYVVVGASPAQMSKRMKVEPASEGSSLSGGGGLQTPSSRSGARNHPHPAAVPQSQQQQQQQQQQHHAAGTTLEQILENLVRVQRDALTMFDRHCVRVEKVIRENTAQTKRLADVLARLLPNAQAGGDNKAATSSDVVD